METEVLMQRELFGGIIHQKSKSEFLCATDLERAGNNWRIKNGLEPIRVTEWLQKKTTKEFIDSLDKKFGKVLLSGRGRGNKTWMHPFLFIDFALTISTELKIEVYGWLYDHLLKYRNDSGDSYKKMSGSLYQAHHNKSKFPHYIMMVADNIRTAIGANDWQTATEKQLEIRDKIHDNIALLCDVLPIDDAVRIGIKKGIEGMKE